MKKQTVEVKELANDLITKKCKKGFKDQCG
jgi:hypothetical protein